MSNTNNYSLFLAACQDKKFAPIRYRASILDRQYGEFITVEEASFDTNSPAVGQVASLTETLDSMIPVVADAHDLSIFVNSGFVVDAYNKWLPNWKRNGWRSKNGSPIATRPWWEKIETILSQADYPTIQRITDQHFVNHPELIDLRPYFVTGFGEDADVRSAAANSVNNYSYTAAVAPPPPEPMLPGMGCW